MADGSVTIECLAKTDKFDKQMAKIQKQIDDKEKKKVAIQTEIDNYEETLAEYDRLGDKAAEYERTLEHLKQKEKELAMATHEKDGGTIFGDLKKTRIDIANVESAYNGVVNQIEKQAPAMAKIEGKVENLKANLSQTTDEAKELKGELGQLKIRKEQTGIEEFKNSLKNTGKEIGNNIAQVGRWAMALVGIRSAYMLIRQASSTIAQYDEQYAANLEYIRYALAMAIKPILEYIVNLAAQLLQYVNYIASIWFGLSGGIFKSADAFKSAKNSLGGMVSSAKELNKQLAGFDEMNILQDNASGASGGGGGGAIAPSIDISGFGGKQPEWLDWIAKNKNKILSVISAVGTGLKALKKGLGWVKSLKLAAAIGGIVYAIQEMIDFMKNPTFEHFGGTLQGIGVAIIGIFSGIPGIIAAVVVIIYGTIIKYWEQIRSFFQSKIDWLTSKADSVRYYFGNTVGNIYNDVVKALQYLLNYFDTYFKSIKGQFQGLLQFFKGAFTGDWNKAWEGLKKGYEAWYQGMTGMFQNFKNYLNYNIVKPIGDLFNGVAQLMKNATSDIWRFFTTTINDAVYFANNAWNSIKNFFINIGYSIGQSIAGAFKAVINAIIYAAENMINSAIWALNNFIYTVNRLPGVNVGYINSIWLPRLATGGIVNLPNKGVNIGGAIAGESGAEGVIPLTDSQAMETLGEAIGRYITINANIVNSMNGRIIGREIKRITGEQSYASNI